MTVPLSYRQTRIVYLGDDPIRMDILEERVRQALLTSAARKCSCAATAACSCRS